MTNQSEPFLADTNQVPVLPEEDGQRLDAVLLRLMPTAGLRTRRRLCDEGFVRLDGRKSSPGTKVRAGQCLHIDRNTLQSTTQQRIEHSSLYQAPPTLIPFGADLALAVKPAHFHTTALAGSNAVSLEMWLQSHGQKGLQLLNRLDYKTSGLVALALTVKGQKLWQEAEEAGRIDKRYLALVQGTLTKPLQLRGATDTAKRKRTRVFTDVEAAFLRHTNVVPLGHIAPSIVQALYPSQSCPPSDTVYTLVGCRIRKGARHQIRAHVADAGFPLYGDGLYANAPENTAHHHAKTHDDFLLHHGGVFLHVEARENPAFLHGVALPTWWDALPLDVQQAAHAWLHAADIEPLCSGDTAFV